MFKKNWYCPDCKTFHHRWNVKRREKFMGLYTLVWYQCPEMECGKPNVLKWDKFREQAVKNLCLTNTTT